MGNSTSYMSMNSVLSGVLGGTREQQAPAATHDMSGQRIMDPILIEHAQRLREKNARSKGPPLLHGPLLQLCHEILVGVCSKMDARSLSTLCRSCRALALPFSGSQTAKESEFLWKSILQSVAVSCSVPLHDARPKCTACTLMSDTELAQYRAPRSDADMPCWGIGKLVVRFSLQPLQLWACEYQGHDLSLSPC